MKKKMKTKTKERVILIARTAAQDQEQRNDQLQAQVNDITTFCQQQNMEIIKTVAVVASSVDFERNDLRRLLKEIKNGHLEADLLLLTKWDRLSRHFFTLQKLIEQFTELGVKPQAITGQTLSEAFPITANLK
jgi:DNA invertase Pin-like site-specific DNA recombinase